eukprot:Em0012g645a
MKDVRRSFSLCTAVDTTDVAWQQAQLSLSRGGLGMRSLSLRSPAAFIASLCSSGYGSLSNHHLSLYAIQTFNESVSPSDAIQSDGFVSSTVHQNQISSKIDIHQFNNILTISSVADKARLLSVSSLHAASWLTVVPSEGLGLHLEPSVFQVAVKWWLGLDTSNGSLCALCPNNALDPLGHHATTCKKGGDIVTRHNQLRNVLAETCRRAHLSVKVEMESYGTWGKEAMDSFKMLASRLAIISSKPKSVVLSELYSRLNLHLQGYFFESLTNTPSSQKAYSGELEDELFRQILSKSSVPDRARLLSVSSPHASAWLSVVPSPGLNLHLEPAEFQAAIQWWLGIGVAHGSLCPHCPHALDPLGHHALTCKHGGDVVNRHNRLRDVFAESCRRACQVEAGSGLGRDEHHTRPADVLATNWMLGKPAAFDFAVTSPLNSSTLHEASGTAGSAAHATEARKHQANDVKCAELGWVSIPVVLETYGCWGTEAKWALSQLASRLAMRLNSPKSTTTASLYGRLSITLVRANVRALLSRAISLDGF